jgi:hypothetical protein
LVAVLVVFTIGATLNAAMTESNEVEVANVHEVEVVTVVLTMSYAELPHEELAVASATNAPVGPDCRVELTVPRSVVMMRSFAFAVVEVGDVTTVTDEPVRVEVASRALEVATPDHSERLIMQLPEQAVESVVVTCVPEPLEFKPYQISESRFVFERTALTQVTPPPEIDEMVELEGLPPSVNSNASPAFGADARFVPSDVPELAVLVACWMSDAPPVVLVVLVMDATSVPPTKIFFVFVVGFTLYVVSG